jgi:hypothetical protein
MYYVFQSVDASNLALTTFVGTPHNCNFVVLADRDSPDLFIFKSVRSLDDVGNVYTILLILKGNTYFLINVSRQFKSEGKVKIIIVRCVFRAALCLKERS